MATLQTHQPCLPRAGEVFAHTKIYKFLDRKSAQLHKRKLVYRPSCWFSLIVTAMRKALSTFFFLFYAPKTLFLELSEIRKRALSENSEFEASQHLLKIFKKYYLSILQCRFDIKLNHFLKGYNFIKKISNFFFQIYLKKILKLSRCCL